MQAELRTYRQDSDLLGEFLADKTRSAPSAQVLQQLLFSRYSHWRMESCVRPISKKQFTQRLVERGFLDKKSGSNRYYVGLTLHEGDGGGVLSTQGENLDRLDGISTHLDKVPHEKLNQEVYENSPTSCPTCPTHSKAEETHA
jgi:hypothetical protein